ncbi:MAG TPA: hypothetical protein VFX12_07240 [Vicinamibacterales bacterium]|nr:hypothetical protein [Vicinamibacterales bacterium]
MRHLAPDTQEPSAPPARCPVCRSNDIVTTSKAVDKTTYWRCRACGEVWNADRRHGGAPWR